MPVAGSVYQVEFVFEDTKHTTATSHLFITWDTIAHAITHAATLASAYQVISSMNLQKVNLIVPIEGYTATAATATPFGMANSKMVTENETEQANSQIRVGVPGPENSIVDQTTTNNPLVTSGDWATFAAAMLAAQVTDKFGNIIDITNAASGFLKSKRRKRVG